MSDSRLDANKTPVSRGRGRPFQLGNPGGPGRPKWTVEQTYLDATLASVPVSAWRKIVAKAVTQAKAGDFRAREWLSRLLVSADPLPLAELVNELKAELERLKFAKPENNGTPLVGRGQGHP